MAWPDERLDDLGDRMDAGFERVDHEIAELRNEMKGDMHTLRIDLKGDMNACQTDLNGRLEQVNERLDRVYGVMVGLSVAVATGLFGIVGALLATGLGG
jgi:hypothetical protein